MALVINTDESGIHHITISRPEALNALNQVTMDELSREISNIHKDAKIKGVIISGAGEKAFVAGADIAELASLSKTEAYQLAKRGQQIFKQIENSPKPVVAAINGFALGGGCELAMACHIRLATQNAKFGQPEINLGIVPGYGGTQRLTQLVGRGKALELLLTADMISAEDAKALGLVNHVFASKDEMIAAAESILKKIISKAPVAIAKIVQAVNGGFSSEEQGYETEAEAFAACAETEDFKEGTAAFLEKRKAVFKGK